MCHQVLNTWISRSIDWDRDHQLNQQVLSFSARHLRYHSQGQEHLVPILKYSLGCVRHCSFDSSLSNFWTRMSLKPLRFIIWTLLMNKDIVSLFAQRRCIKEISLYYCDVIQETVRSLVLRKVLHYSNNPKDVWILLFGRTGAQLPNRLLVGRRWFYHLRHVVFADGLRWTVADQMS